MSFGRRLKKFKGIAVAAMVIGEPSRDVNTGFSWVCTAMRKPRQLRFLKVTLAKIPPVKEPHCML